MTDRAPPAERIAWVTGASSGIGRATALELARRGFLVAVTARRIEALEVLAQEAIGSRGRIVAHPGDVTDERRMTEIVDGIERLHGPIALAFLNAGVAPSTAPPKLDPAAFRTAYEVNVLGVVNGLAPLLARMAGRGAGHIAVNGSIAGYGGLPGAAAYGASKAAVIHLCEALRPDCDRLGVTIQIVNPGFVDTPLTRRNAFAMPFLAPLDKAARRICDGFERDCFEVTFPRRLSYLSKAVNLLPYRLYFQLIRLVTGASRRRDRRVLRGS